MDLKKKIDQVVKKRRLSFNHLISIDEARSADIELIFELAAFFKKEVISAGASLDVLTGKTIINFFSENSTRTRTSFEMAGKILGANVVNITADSSSMSKKGESLYDMGRTLASLKPDCVVMRHVQSGSVFLFSQAVAPLPVINAGDGWNEHPTQGILDAFTINEKLGTLKNKNILIVGDIMHSRVFGSLARIARLLGARVSVCGPPTMIPAFVKEEFAVKVYYELDKALPEAEVIYCLRVQTERAASAFIPSLAEYARLYCLTAARLKLAAQGAIVMHPGPVNRDLDLAHDVMFSEQNAVEEQVSNGLATRLALLYLLLS